MNKGINLVEILKNVPNGTKLWSPICGECEFTKILPIGLCQIQVKHTEGNTYHFYNFTAQGKYSNDSEAECLLFPSKDNRDWSTFKTPLEHKHFEPFQKVLVASRISDIWEPDMYRLYDSKHNIHECMRFTVTKDNHIIPYEGNEDKLGKPVK